MLVDLHLHTTCSDGVWEPDRLFAEIRSRNLEAFCVSDHDCVDVYPVPQDLHSRAIPGLEVDSHHGGHTAHILAYGIGDPQSPLLQTLRAQRQARIERMHAMIERMQHLGLAITMDHVRAQTNGSSSLGRPHLARALVQLGYCSSTNEAFDRFIADDAPGYVALERLESAAAIALIHESGGVAVIAHPLRLRAPEHVEQLIALGVDGIEVVHPTADEQARERLTKIARKHDLLVTGGTDFHAPVPDRPLGIELSAQDVERLRGAIQSRCAAMVNSKHVL